MNRHSLLKNTVLLVVFLAPICYIGIICSTAIHEIVGHGLSAIAYDGTFDGFIIRWDGMGWAYAYVPEGSSITATIIHLAAGIIANILAGLMFLAIAYWLRRKLFTRLCLLILASINLLDGLSYAFWNAYLTESSGDIGRMIEWLCYYSSFYAVLLRFSILVVSGAMFLIATFFTYALTFQGVEQTLLGGDRFSSRVRFWILLLFFVSDAAIWFAFDWEQVIPGIGRLPCYASAVMLALTALILYWYSLKPDPKIPAITPGWRHQLASWGCLVVVVILMHFWLHDGVFWG